MRRDERQKAIITGRDIINPNDPTSVQAAAYLAYAWDMAMPPMIGSNGVESPLWLLGPEYGGKLAQAASGATNRRGDSRATLGQAAARLVGLNVYGIDPVLTRQANLAQMATSIKLTRLQLRSKLSDQGLTVEQKAEILAKYTEKLKDLAKEMDEYSKRSEVPDFGRRGLPNE